ncbi:MAG: alpha/beta hydrolase [Bacteroidota bacterium]
MPQHLLLLHGNGGTRTRFVPMLEQWPALYPEVELHIPELSGFAGRPLPASGDYWSVFLQEIGKCVADVDSIDWVLYGHGIGGSLLMEWGARGYPLPDGSRLKPRKVILHSIIGASLHKRFFPKLMRPMWIRSLMQSLITARWMQPRWEKRLFRFPDQIPSDLKRQFFADYAECEAFPVFFDMLTVPWYRSVRERHDGADWHLLWGDLERIVAAKYLDLWRADFPAATIESVPDWDHFPMLDQPMEFVQKIGNLISR